MLLPESGMLVYEAKRVCIRKEKREAEGNAEDEKNYIKQQREDAQEGQWL